MNREHKTTLAVIFAGWVGLCLACSSGGSVAPPITRPTPLTFLFVAQWPQPHYPKTKPKQSPAPTPTPGRIKCTAYQEDGKTKWRCVDVATGKPVEGEG